MKKSLIPFAVIALVISSCKKNDTPADTRKTYLTKEIFQSTGSRTWTYDAQNKLTNIEFASTNEASNPSYNFRVNTLDAGNRVVDATIDYINPTIADIKIVNVFGTDGKMITSTEQNPSTGATLSYYTFQYTATQTTVAYKNGAGIAQFSNVYTLSADGKNVVKNERYNGSAVLTNTDVYSAFDDKKTAQSIFVPGFSVIPYNTNNFTTDTYTQASTGAITVYTYTYEYNSDGYATKRISASGATITYEYVKK